MVTQFGMSEKIGPVCLDEEQEVFVGNSYGRSSSYSGKTAALIDEEIKRIAEECYGEAVRVLRENRDKLDLLTEALLKHETISRQEFVTLMDTGVMPEITAANKPRSLHEILEQAKAEETSAEAEKVETEGNNSADEDVK